jgi:hypothetical protein
MSRFEKQIDWLKNLRRLCRDKSDAASVLCEIFHKVGDLVKIVRCFQKK